MDGSLFWKAPCGLRFSFYVHFVPLCGYETHENAISRSVGGRTFLTIVAGVLRIRGRADCSNLNTPFDFAGAFATLFFDPHSQLAPTLRRLLECGDAFP